MEGLTRSAKPSDATSAISGTVQSGKGGLRQEFGCRLDNHTSTHPTAISVMLFPGCMGFMIWMWTSRWVNK